MRSAVSILSEEVIFKKSMRLWMGVEKGMCGHRELQVVADGDAVQEPIHGDLA
jgi:hypothetical protein